MISKSISASYHVPSQLMDDIPLAEFELGQQPMRRVQGTSICDRPDRRLRGLADRTRYRSGGPLCPTGIKVNALGAAPNLLPLTLPSPPPGARDRVSLGALDGLAGGWDPVAVFSTPPHPALSPFGGEGI